ncbi:hypothetical protein KFE25_014404 [Diacronema lutheri]|uniref:CRAL-TRIO domain-containing protein n=1 Tax=Diacronema lutheri TaxID=2081491 RepID=A0A8J5X735_DIALT|nr:hypothetical protein KFE25_014404 [Diacronema lutheri]
MSTSIAQVRARVLAECEDKDALAAFLTDRTIGRYLAANEDSVETASHQLVGSWQWQQRVRPHALVCAACERDARSHSLRPVGFDAQGRLVLYTCFATAHDRFDPATATAHLTRLLHDAQALLDSDERLAPKWVLVVDFHGYALRDNNPRTATNAIWLLHHFPERLGLALLLDAPLLFGALWRAIRRLLKPSTAQKVSFVSSMDTTDPNVLALGTPMIAWLRAEAAENRSPYGAAKRHWEPPAEKRPHDARGLQSFVADQRAWCSFHWYGEQFVDASED